MVRHWVMIPSLLLIAASSIAAEVYINGQPLGSLKGVTMQNCTVNIDNFGGVNIMAPGFNPAGASGSSVVTPGPAAAPTPAATSFSPPPTTSGGNEEGLAIITQHASGAPQNAPAPITQQTFVIATSGLQSSALPLAFKFFANGEEVHNFTSADVNKIYDITPYLNRGPNHCKLMVLRDKSYRAGAKYDPGSEFFVRIQVGNAMQGQFRPSQTLAEIVRNGLQMTEAIQEFTLIY